MYYSKLDTGCGTDKNKSTFEVVTVSDTSDKALVQNDCSQNSREVPIAELDVKPYRQDHVILEGKIFEHEMSRDSNYFNEALCDFADKGFGILIRWYDTYLFHVAHTFTSTNAYTTPVIRYSDYDFGNGNFGIGYQGTDFALAVLDNYKMAENAFAGYYNGKVNGQSVEALGLCVTTTHKCSPLDLTLNKTSSSIEEFSVAGADAQNGISVNGTLLFSGDLGDLKLTVSAQSATYDCKGYVSKLNNELTLGGCTDRPTTGSPKKVMVQVRGKIEFIGAQQGRVKSKVCLENKTSGI